MITKKFIFKLNMKAYIFNAANVMQHLEQRLHSKLMSKANIWG